jgi:hypothetical protein
MSSIIGFSYPATSSKELNIIVRYFLEYHPTIPCEKCNGSKTYYFNPNTKMVTYIGERKAFIKCPVGSVTSCIECIRKAI